MYKWSDTGKYSALSVSYQPIVFTVGSQIKTGLWATRQELIGQEP